MWNKLEKQGLTILETLERAGHEAFFVGGYVRDKLWGKPVKDMDIATSALPEEVIGLFARTIPTGLKHGTVTVLIEGTPFEVTTYRKDSDYADYRRPNEVEFISELEEDLRRRDFTMNAMAMDRYGVIRDPFGGQEDIKRGLLRSVGRAEERFREDALRMLRCIRFASNYELRMDEAAWEALLANRELLRHVAMERVRAELERMLAGPAPCRGLGLLLDSGLLACTKERLAWAYEAMDSSAMPEALSALDDLAEPLHRWSLLVLEAGVDGSHARELLRLMTFSLKDMERVSMVADVEGWVKEWSWSAPEPQAWDGIEGCSPADLWKLAALRFGREAMEDWLTVRQAVRDRGFLAFREAAVLLSSGQSWLEEMPVQALRELAVSGKVLLAESGRGPGPWVGQAMSRLLRLAALGRVPNRREALLEEASRSGMLRSHD